MGKAQNDFLSAFRAAFTQRFSSSQVVWTGGQVAGNVAQLPPTATLRRGGIFRRAEQFEIGDTRTHFRNKSIVIEYDHGQLPLSNLVKYWPYIRGELSVKPESPIILCHFSSWWSYGTYRDLWDWVMLRMCADDERLKDIKGRQFDNGVTSSILDIEQRDHNIQMSLDWIDQMTINQ